MREYILSLLGVGVVGAAVRALSPDAVMKKYISLICSLCAMCAVILPLRGVISELDIGGILSFEEGEGDINYEEIYNSFLASEGKRQAEEILLSEACAELGRDTRGLELELIAAESDSGLELVGVRVTIGIEGVGTDPSALSDIIEERLGVECEIIYDIFDE